MYRGAETSSSFYQAMRSAYAAGTGGSNNMSSGMTSTPQHMPTGTAAFPPSSHPASSSSLFGGEAASSGLNWGVETSYLQQPQQPAVGSTMDHQARTTMAEIQHRLRNMGRLPSASAAPPSGASQYNRNPAASSSLLQSAQQLLSRHDEPAMENGVSSSYPQQPQRAGARGGSESQQQSAPRSDASPPQVGVDDDETLLPAELRSLRMVEIAAPVRVLLGELQHPPRPMQLLAEEANVKIFPRHVYISRAPNGAPIAEIVILELSELTEDANKGSLTFYIKRSSNPTTTIVELQCADPAARSAMYKIVCSKRSALENAVVMEAAATVVA